MNPDESELSVAIPLYLDSNSLFDVLLSLRGGYAVMEPITAEQAHANEELARAGTALGASISIGSKLALFKVSERDEHERIQTTARYHTLGSLLHELRRELRRSRKIRLIHAPEDWETVAPSDFVELAGEFERNPLIESINNTRDVLKITQSIAPLAELSGSQAPSGKIDQKNRGGANSRSRNGSTKTAVSQANMILKFLDSFLADDSLELPEYFVVNAALRDGDESAKVVVPIFQSYLRDRNGIELAGGTFHLLGKVASILDENERFDLLQGTQLRGLRPDSLGTLMKMFDSLDRLVEIAEFSRYVCAPALVVIPVAVFV